MLLIALGCGASHAEPQLPPQSAPQSAPLLPVASPSLACRPAIAAATAALGLPPGLLLAIGMVESGRIEARTGRVEPWPWSINAAGVPYVFASRDEAIAMVGTLRQKGVQSIDVGCMQVNLMHHPNAFPSLDDAFDPAVNARYAADFLARLHAQTGTWLDAAAAYHSQTPGLSDGYRIRVVAAWPGAPPGAMAAALAQQELAQGAASPSAPRFNDNQLPSLRDRLRDRISDRAHLARIGVLNAPISRERVARAPGGAPGHTLGRARLAGNLAP